MDRMLGKNNLSWTKTTVCMNLEKIGPPVQRKCEFETKVMSLTTGFRDQQGNLRRMNQARPICVICRDHHGVWRCDRFKNQ